MRIVTTYDKNGARTDSVELTSEEKDTIDKAIEIIKSSCTDAGYPENYKDWNDERLRLLGIMRFDGGIDAVLKFASTAEILQFQEKKETRGYA